MLAEGASLCRELDLIAVDWIAVVMLPILYRLSRYSCAIICYFPI